MLIYVFRGCVKIICNLSKSICHVQETLYVYHINIKWLCNEPPETIGSLCQKTLQKSLKNYKFSFQKSTVVGQAVACSPVTHLVRVRSPVRTGFLGEIFRSFSSPVRQMSRSFRPPRSPNIIWPSLSSSIHYGRQWPEMLTRPKTSNIHSVFRTRSSVY